MKPLLGTGVMQQGSVHAVPRRERRERERESMRACVRVRACTVSAESSVREARDRGERSRDKDRTGGGLFNLTPSTSLPRRVSGAAKPPHQAATWSREGEGTGAKCTGS